MSKGFKLFLRIILYCFSYLLIDELVMKLPAYIGISISYNLVSVIALSLLAVEIITIEKIIDKKEQEKQSTDNTKQTKICKYCKSEINANATVCPVCRKGLTFNTNTGVLAVLLIIIGFMIWGILSNDAPLFIRETVCGIGIRNDFPYCYYIDYDN